MMQHLVCLVLCLASAYGWTPGPARTCSNLGTLAGDSRFPHEKFCQVFYSCDQFQNRFRTVCPKPSLFAYGDGVTTCSVLGSTKYTCPYWPCASDIDKGRKYPDVCCGKYWECTKPGKYTSKECETGETFNFNLERCVNENSNTCTNDEYCYADPSSNWLNNINDNPNHRDFDCFNTASTLTACEYFTDGWAKARKCPLGTQYDPLTCSCSQVSVGCSSSGLTQADFIIQKKPDAECRASGKIEFRTPTGLNGIETYTLKNGISGSNNGKQQVDHYYDYNQKSTDPNFVTFNQGEANFNGNGALYDYYYVDNILFAPLAISLTVKFTQPNAGFNQNNKIKLLENVYQEGVTKYCSEATIGIYATYAGAQNGLNQWTFELVARGEGTTRNIVLQTSATIAGSSSDYFRVVYNFNKSLNGFVENRGPFGTSVGVGTQKVTINQSSGSLTGRIGTNKCGFSIGYNLLGKIRDFAVYEGCMNHARIV